MTDFASPSAMTSFVASDADRDLDARIATLVGHWRAGDPGDLELQRTVGHGIVELRRLWQRAADLFSPSAVQALKGLARELEQAPRGDPQAVLRGVFGYQQFRPGQREIIDAVMRGRDCIGVMPTGAGKSLTYQVPARLLPGVTLVLSPLIALMKDQVDAATEVGLKATFLNSTLTADERRRRVDDLVAGKYELLYCAPEALEASVGAVLPRLKLSLIAVDEAHCISQWGHDFRPAYRNLSGLKQRAGGAPLLALTATATPEVTRDIVEQLAMIDPGHVRGSFFRSNLNLSVRKKGEGSTSKAITQFVRDRQGQRGIIYCLSRKSVESTAERLRRAGVAALPYHAGLEAQTRERAQDAFARDDVDVIVATIAFGMGIDKSNIRFIVHRDLPRSVENYYQEIGRAGRDGLPSECLLFYSYADVVGYERLLQNAPADERERCRTKSRQMLHLAERGGCRHQALVAHLGQTIGPCKTVGVACDSCGLPDPLAQPPRRPRREKIAVEPRWQVVKTVARDDAEGESDEQQLFERLRAHRRALADAKGLPAYLVLSDAVLWALVRARPRSLEELATVPGIGPKKLAQYGAEFLRLL